ncbi:phosphoesterase, dhha1 [Luminiphilus syltensis NOR5-1B]|uniref:Phosphoesterase, dhha1 n=1 Tax=Luminiphilus syltensis NOR5-1B TaxID=565045 RepID=B8KX40_9GAMM|nr:hypothetical protein [Luminiphilus syltensis]EED34259.1 phosphoesterase, dhha1 [Luminiphilus syltensis NOR5-1B]
MTAYDVFNGDADGICALLQLRQVDPRDATLVTGVKRDIALLQHVSATTGDQITVLDISLDKNRAALIEILEVGAEVFYCDHHYPGEIPEHPNLRALINTAPEVSTSALINGSLKGARAPWAVVGCFGDNLNATANKLAKTIEKPVDLNAWRELGVLLNYNGYGATVSDLHFDPGELFKRLLPHPSPDDFLAQDAALFETLQGGYEADMASAESSTRTVEDQAIAVIELPDEPWSRRVSGVYGNHLANLCPGRAHAVLTHRPGGFLVSVRAPLNNRQGADEVCRQFDTGGGRSAAAGINHLAEADLNRFVDALRAQYR